MSEQDDATPIRHSEDGEPMTKAERIFVRLSILQTILAVAGIFTGVVALYAALSEADAVRKQQAAAVLPVIVVARSQTISEDEGFFEWNAFNWGIGPGRVQALRMLHNGEPVRDWDHLLERIGLPETNYEHSQITGRTYTASNEPDMVFRTRNRELAVAMLEASRNTEMDLCYCSVFETCWMMPRSFTDAPPRVEICPDYGDDAFIQ
ncbi:hypothetical protein [Ponticaulis sp.]|uniref:hypothetical protein n=1 Tax=Ponticaulis sp. TaxID=2020902 RepID=UPI0025FCDBFE|nr:hypothetical protein [Ponticaulis sp.]|tara:strand:+ start:6372 stop:6992 length:621 start_codon:yes stop_codon:yes gene_type:complete